MYKTRIIELICWAGDNFELFEVFSLKYPFNRKIRIAEFHSPVIISDALGNTLKVWGNGKIKKRMRSSIKNER